MAAGPLPNDQAPRPDRPEPADSAHALLFKHRRMVTLLRIADTDH